MGSNDNYFKINFFSIDSYVTKPHPNHDKTYSEYRKSNINLATVVRVFGSTDSGIKTCLHIHQHCPHLSLRHKDLVEAFGIISEDSEIDQKILDNLIQDVENDLVKHINSNNKNEVFIVNIEKYKAYSFYGYHEKKELFYKLYFNSFWMANKAKQSLESGLINNYKFVCYNFLEFLLQFYIDHQIYLNVLYFNEISFRKPIIENSIPKSNCSSFESIKRRKFLSIKNFINYNDLSPTSTCTLECDASIKDIILLERRKTVFPLNNIFKPTMPGIVELWNKQHKRLSEEFEDLLKILRNSFYEQFEQTFQYNQIKKNCLVEKDFHSIQIPQLDGANDSDLVQSKIFCVFKNKRVEIDVEKFENSLIVGQKIDQIKKSNKNLSFILKNFRISIENSSKKEFLGTIANKIKPFQLAALNLIKLKNELKSYKLKNLLIKQKPKSAPGSNPKKLKLYFSKVENFVPKPSKSRRFPISMLNEPNFFQNSIQFDKIPQNLQNISTILNKTSNTNSVLDCKNETFDQLNDMLEWSQCLNMTLMSLELHARVRQNLTPDPNYDPIQMVVFAVYEEFLTDFQPKQNLTFEKVKRKKSNILYMGSIVVRPKNSVSFENFLLNNRNISIDYVQTELDLISKLSFYVSNFDPDIVLGYVVDTFSWGYLLQRVSNLGIEIGPLFSRIHNQSKRNSAGELNKSPHLIGRIVLNIWHLLRHELTLRCYTFETVHHHLFKRRYPKYPNELLSTIWNLFTSKHNDLCKHFIIGYYLERVLGSLRILSHLNFIRRTFDLSCLFGMQFQDVIDRGTQFRVESMLFPLCHTEQFLPIRFGQDFIKQQKACQATPMIFEPMTAYYQEPVAVFDFQSLYPSIVIAYNYCYSTCLGRLQNIVRNLEPLGCYRKPCDKTILNRLGRNNIHISPNDVLFVKSCVRRGMLPRMLEEILNTRILIKKELKNVDRELSLLMVKPNHHISAEQRKKLRALKRQLDISQLGLKLIANVTYGYTNANFSGRMPCVEVADAIVSKGREILEEVVVFINEWGTRSGTKVKVIYGDTDSVFVSFPNTSVENAFEIANFLLKEINQRQTYPICLKLEKIYKPCILLAKKRYCGFAYESPTASSLAKFDAKGIETIRRDTCNITAKIMEKCIKILSECNGDIESLKSYLQLQFKKILTGQLSHLEDFIFAREFHGFQNYCHEKIIPACIIARKRMELDPRNQPKFKERVPYVIVDNSNMKITRLCDLVREPIDFLQDESLKINARYYINNVIIPPLVRILDSVHNNGLTILRSWYEEVRHSKRNINFITSKHLKKLSLIKSTMSTDPWQSRDKILNNKDIRKYSKPATLILNSIWNCGQKLKHHEWICSRCCQTDIRTLVSLSSSSINHHRCLVDNCPNLFNYHQIQKDLQFLYFWDQALLIKLNNNSDDNHNIIREN